MSIEFVSADDVRTGRGGRSGSGVHYSKYMDAIAPLVPYLKEQIAKAKDGIIRVKNKEIAKELGAGFAKLNATSIYWGLKSSLFEHDIIVKTGTHIDGDKILTMRAKEEGDILPSSLTNGGKRPVEGKKVKVTDSDVDLLEDEDLEPEE